MEPIQRVIMGNNWMTIVFIIALIFLVFLKAINPVRLKGAVFALFNKGFIEIEVEKNAPIFTFFKSLLFLFSSLIFSIVAFLLIKNYIETTHTDLLLFIQIFVFLTAYLLIKRMLEFSVGFLFGINNHLKYFIISKYSSLYSISFAMFILVLLHTYSSLHTLALLLLLIFAIGVRFVIVFINNKKLILSELFYFILYLCAFEIAPLFILFKWMF